MAQTIKLRCTRPMLYGGRHVAAGEFLDLAPAAAADALESGRAELVDAADRPAVWAGRAAEVQREMRLHGRQMQTGSPWQPVAGGWH